MSTTQILFETLGARGTNLLTTFATRTARFACRHRPAALFTALVVLTSSCARYIPSPVPRQVRPTVPRRDPAPKAGQGRVLLNIVDGPSRVELVYPNRFSTTDPERPLTRHLCDTPCYAELEIGTHSLRVIHLQSRREQTSNVTFFPSPTVFSEKMGERRTSPEMSIIGIGLTTLGVILGGLTLTLVVSDDIDRSLSTPQQLMVVGGTAGFVGGVLLLYLARPEIHVGAQSQWLE